MVQWLGLCAFYRVGIALLVGELRFYKLCGVPPPPFVCVCVCVCVYNISSFRVSALFSSLGAQC